MLWELTQAVTKAKKSPNLPNASGRARDFDAQWLEKTEVQLREGERIPSLTFAFHAGPQQTGHAHRLLYSVC